MTLVGQEPRQRAMSLVELRPGIEVRLDGSLSWSGAGQGPLLASLPLNHVEERALDIQQGLAQSVADCIPLFHFNHPVSPSRWKNPATGMIAVG